jgi:phosphate-selective porin OprO/OprP
VNRGFVLLLILAITPPAAAQSPSVRAGDWLHAQVHARLQADVRGSQAPLSGGDRFELGRRRIGVEGRIARVFGYEVEYDIGTGRWRDTFLDYRQFKALQVRAGTFKLPVGLEANTSAANLDFIHRARISERLAPGRDRGVSVRGALVGGRLEYDAGAFRNDGDNARRQSSERVFGGATLAARMATSPFRRTKTAASTLQLGAALSRSQVPLGFPAIRARTALDFTFFNPRVWVQGTRMRTALEARWRPGRLALQAEYIRLTDERTRQSVEESDLPPLLAHGWYLSATYRVADKKSRLGRVDAAGRFETLDFGSTAGDGELSSSMRAPRILGNGERALTLGANWHPHRWVKVQANLIRERLHNPSLGPYPAGPVFWSRVVRLQVAI